MFKFEFLRMAKDYFGHMILIALPSVLIIFFGFIYSGQIINMVEASTYLTIGFALTFQLYGSSLGYENIAYDFFSPMRNRILAAPANPRSIVISTLIMSSIINFLQTIVVIVFSVIVLKTKFSAIIPIILVMILAIITIQLLGAVVLFLTKQFKSATAIMTLYAIISPFIAGLYFPLPDSPIFEIMKRYVTTMSLAQTAIYGIINTNYQDILIGVIPLVILSIIFISILKPLSKKVLI